MRPAAVLAIVLLGCEADPTGVDGGLAPLDARGQDSGPLDAATAEDAGATVADAAAREDAAAALPDAAVGPPPGWSTCPRLPGGPRQETAVVALAGELYVLGGFDGASRVVPTVEIFDPIAGQWRAGPSLPVPMHHAQAAVVGDRIVVLGFLTGLDFRADGRAFALTRGAARWEPIAALPAGTQRGGGATAVVGDRVYVIGGLRSGAVTDVTVYDAATDTHAAGVALPEPRDHLGAAAIGERVYVIGGRAARIESHQPDTWILDPGATTWRSARPMPTSRGGFALATVGERIFVLGGEGDTGNASGVFEEVESYASAADTWDVAAAMPEPKHGTGAASIDGVVYVPGGADRQAFGAVATCAAYTPYTP